VAIRGLIELNRADSGAGVPFTHMARVGSREGQRGYPTGRFRDRDAVALMSEWRYEVWRELQDRSRVEGFVFLDVSGVEHSLSALDRRDLSAGYGFGMRVVLQRNVAFLWYLGISEETTRLRATVDAGF
jgi:hemolysin activation/secretion protein